MITVKPSASNLDDLPPWRQTLGVKYAWTNPRVPPDVLAVCMLQRPCIFDLSVFAREFGVKPLLAGVASLDAHDEWSRPSARVHSLRMIGHIQEALNARELAQ